MKKMVADMFRKTLNYLVTFKNRPRWMARLIISRALLATRLCKLFTIRLGDVKLRFFPTKFSADLWFPAVNIFQNYNLPFLCPGDTAIDIGANIGLMTILFAKNVGPEGIIYSFEPNPLVFGYLRQNLQLNGLLSGVRLFSCALGNRQTTAFLKRDEKSDTADAICAESTGSFAVNIDCLDTVLGENQYNPIKLLKIDTEGYEKFVLEGAIKTLSRTDCVIIEAIEENCRRFDYGVRDLVDLLRDQGFSTHAYNSELGRFSEFDPEAFLQPGQKSFLYDLFAVKRKELLTDVRWA